ncbi:hypothetical protein [Candidatus Poriferisodalis sp.]|uniref:hypothetical protein n=1 Tax=Candidatus Poriferisodalis sp. TaxID=3101277 RepID=UPI003B010DB2
MNRTGADGRPDGDDRRVPWALRRGVSVAVTTGALVAAAAVVLAVWLTRGSDTVSSYPVGLEGVVPAPDAQAPRQTPVGARLEPGWEPTIIIDGVRIPSSQLDAGTIQLGEYFFAPGEGKAIERLRSGQVCAVVRAAPVTALEAPDLVYRWCFVTF